MTKREMLCYAESLILEAEDQRDRIERTQPSRVYLARAVIDDAVRAFVLLQSARVTRAVRMRIAAYYVRADMMTRALQVPVQ